MMDWEHGLVRLGCSDVEVCGGGAAVDTAVTVCSGWSLWAGAQGWLHLEGA